MAGLQVLVKDNVRGSSGEEEVYGIPVQLSVVGLVLVEVERGVAKARQTEARSGNPHALVLCSGAHTNRGLAVGRHGEEDGGVVPAVAEDAVLGTNLRDDALVCGHTVVAHRCIELEVVRGIISTGLSERTGIDMTLELLVVQLEARLVKLGGRGTAGNGQHVAAGRQVDRLVGIIGEAAVALPEVEVGIEQGAVGSGQGLATVGCRMVIRSGDIPVLRTFLEIRVEDVGGVVVSGTEGAEIVIIIHLHPTRKCLMQQLIDVREGVVDTGLLPRCAGISVSKAEQYTIVIIRLFLHDTHSDFFLVLDAVFTWFSFLSINIVHSITPIIYTDLFNLYTAGDRDSHLVTGYKADPLLIPVIRAVNGTGLYFCSNHSIVRHPSVSIFIGTIIRIEQSH